MKNNVKSRNRVSVRTACVFAISPQHSCLGFVWMNIRKVIEFNSSRGMNTLEFNCVLNSVKLVMK